MFEQKSQTHSSIKKFAIISSCVLKTPFKFFLKKIFFFTQRREKNAQEKREENKIRKSISTKKKKIQTQEFFWLFLKEKVCSLPRLNFYLAVGF